MFIKTSAGEFQLAATLRAIRAIEKRTNKSIMKLIQTLLDSKYDDMMLFLADGLVEQSKRAEFLNSEIPLQKIYEYIGLFSKELVTSGMSPDEVAEFERKNEEALMEMGGHIPEKMGQ